VADKTHLRAPHSLLYARIEVPDIQASREYYEYHVGLVTEDVSPERITLRAGIPHHTIELLSAPERETAWTTAVGFSVETMDVLDDIGARLDAAGIEKFDLDPHIKALSTAGFAVKDPNGLIIELTYEFQEFAEEPHVELRPTEMVHPFISTDKYEESHHFYVDVLGFRPSDYIADATAFLRSENRFHHSFALRRDTSFYVAHLCFVMKSLDHVFRMRARAIYKNVPIPSDMVNHSASHSIAFYMHDLRHGPRSEICDGHRRLTQEEHDVTHRARRMSVDPRNIDVWRAAADDWAHF
jgi:catechol 2,3-dioxygenase-like lactoylglutathione lyase family enzyme